MAEFQKVAQHWKRMCKKYWTATSCHGCPIAEHERGYEACSAYEADVVKMEELVMAWAAEYPEPVYPTWREWLIKNGLIEFKPDFRSMSLENSIIECLNEKAKDPIPADIAEKLGIQPKEG